MELGENSDVAISGQPIPAAGPFTISIWLRRTGDSSGTQTHVFGNGAGTSHLGFRCALRESLGFRPALSGWKGSAGDINFDVQATSGPEIVLDKWFQVSYQWDGTTTAGGVKVFVNGALQASGTAKAMLPSSTTPTEHLNLGSTETSRGFVGWVGAVYAYNSVLSEAELRNNFDATRMQFGV